MSFVRCIFLLCVLCCCVSCAMCWLLFDLCCCVLIVVRCCCVLCACCIYCVLRVAPWLMLFDVVFVDGGGVWYC